MTSRISTHRIGRGRLAAAVSAVALVATLLPGPTAAAGPIFFDGSPGTNPPPATLGGYPMTPFGPDGLTAPTTTTSVPAPGGRTLTFGGPVNVYNLGQLVTGWTPGYTGHVYARYSSSVTITLPPTTRAFYFYAVPVAYCPGATANVTATASDGTTSGPVSITVLCNGSNSARYFGFYATGGTTLSTITLAYGTPATAVDFAEFGISYLPGPSAAPVVTSFSPLSGRVGSTVTITGTSFGYATRVTFNGVPATFSVRTPTTIVATVPAGATTGPIAVSTPSGMGVSPLRFYVKP